MPAAPTYAGYAFNGWFSAASGGTALTSPYTLTTSTTLYAQWTANATDTYSSAARGTGSAPASGSGLDGTTVTLPANTFAYPGHTFTGWSDGTFGYPAGTTYLLSSAGSAIVFTAQWTANPTITITFNSEGGSAVSTATGLQGTTITLPAAPTYAGYTFNGWFSAASGGTALTSPYTLTTSTTLYAQWTANPTITITFNSEGGSSVSTATGLHGTTITLPAAPTYAGYTFNGWFSAASGGTALTSPYTLTTSTTLYAQWTVNPTTPSPSTPRAAAADLDGHGPPGHHHHLAGRSHLRRLHLQRLVQRRQRRHGAHLALHPDHVHHPLRPVDGQRHRHLQLRGGRGHRQRPGLGLGPRRHHRHLARQHLRLPRPHLHRVERRDIELPRGHHLPALERRGGHRLHRPWTANPTITITFNSEGGNAVSTATGLQGTTITLPAAPTYAGYTFNGWFSAASGGTALTSPYTLTTSTTLYAQWTANATDTYSFAAGGGTGSAPASGSGLDGTTVTLPANTFAYPGHTFTGWSDGTLSYPAGTTYLLSSAGAAIVFTAQWTANPTITITFNSEGGTRSRRPRASRAPPSPCRPLPPTPATPSTAGSAPPAAARRSPRPTP